MKLRGSGTPEEVYWEIQPRPERIVEWAGQTGQLEAEEPMSDLPPWHHGFRLKQHGGTADHEGETR